jgi:hypothetical protein
MLKVSEKRGKNKSKLYPKEPKESGLRKNKKYKKTSGNIR